MSDVIRFIHAADLHIDSPLRGLARYEGVPDDVVRRAPREAFSNLVDRALDEQVDFVVLAGDLVDGDWPDFNTGHYLARQFARLDKAGIPVITLRGNHDAASEVTKSMRWPESVREFGYRKPETIQLAGLKVALHGQSFRERDIHDNLAASYPAPIPGWINIGVLHTALEGHAEHASYAPCSVAELKARGYQYWALGHVHEYQVVCDDPKIVFPGNLQGRSVRETGPRGAVLVEIAGTDISVERLLVDVLRWHVVVVDVTEATSFPQCVDFIAKALAQAFEQQSSGLPMATRVRLQGRCRAHGDLFRHAQQLRAEVIGVAAGISDRLWIEKVQLETLAPDRPPVAAQAGQEAVGDLLEIMKDAASDPEFLEHLKATLGDDLMKVDHEVLNLCPPAKALRDGDLDEVITRSAANVASQLYVDRG